MKPKTEAIKTENSVKMRTENNQPLLTSYQLGTLSLPNRIVMAPMTRNRSDTIDHSPVQIEGEYYAQRASAGLIITGGIMINPTAFGGIRQPALFTDAHVEAWKPIVENVHKAGGRIFAQICHQGSASHPDVLRGAQPVAPSEINPKSKVMTREGFEDTIIPRALSIDEIKGIIADYGNTAKRALDAGFDGIELHCSVIYLLPQFMSTIFNQRTDEYGGPVENRVKIVLEVLAAIAAHWPKDKMGIKFAPGLHNLGAMRINEDTLPTYDYLVGKLNEMEIGHACIMRPMNDISDTPAAILQNGTYKHFRPKYRGTLIANLGFDHNSANEIIKAGDADLVAFAKYFIANPDLPKRFELGLPLSEPEQATFYQGGPQGYITYPNAE